MNYQKLYSVFRKKAILLLTLLTVQFIPTSQDCILTVNNCISQWVSIPTGSSVDIRDFVVNGSYLYSGTAVGGIYRSTNNGTNWTQVLASSFIASFGTLDNSIFAGKGNLGGIIYSTNNGANWYSTSLLYQSVFSIVTKGGILFACSNNYPDSITTGGIFKSVNSGLNWSRIIFSSPNVWSLLVVGNNIYAGTENNGVYYSTNDGVSWISTDLNNNGILDMASNGSNIFAGTTFSGLYRSTNNGVNWTQTTLNNQTVRTVVAYNNNIIAGEDWWGVYLSTDNGVTWTQRNEGMGNKTINSLFIANNYVFAGTHTASVYRRDLSEFLNPTKLNLKNGIIPNRYLLFQNYPNPFNPNTTIKFQIKDSRFVTLKVFDMLGKEVKALVNEKLSPGIYEVNFDGSNLPSGMYFYTIRSGDFTDTKRMLLVK